MFEGCAGVAVTTASLLLSTASLAFAQAPVRAGGEFQVNTYTANHQTNDERSLAVGANGDFVVVWQSEQDGSGYGVFGQRFASSGARLGAEFQINSYTSGSQRDPAVGADADG